MKFLTSLSEKIKKYFFVLEQNEVLRKEINFLQNNVLESLLKDLESLEQDKFYFIIVPKATEEELERIKQYVIRASQDMKWSPPNVLLLNSETKIIEREGGIEKHVQVRNKSKIRKNAHKNEQRNKKH